MTTPRKKHRSKSTVIGSETVQTVKTSTNLVEYQDIESKTDESKNDLNFSLSKQKIKKSKKEKITQKRN